MSNLENNSNFQQDRESRYQSIFESASVGILNMKRDGGFIQANPYFCNFIGYSEEQLLKMNILDITHPDDIEKTKAGFREARLNQRVEFDKRYIRKDGNLIWGRVSSSWINMSDGEISVAIIQDITEKKRVELENQKSISLLQATFESTADGILVMDLNGHIVSYNKKFLRLWDIPDSMMASRNGEEVLSFVMGMVKDQPKVLAKIRELQAHSDLESLDIMELMDGRVFELHTIPQRISDVCVGRVLNYRDITERKNLELERLRHEKLESLGLLAGGIAHDFNNILTGILGNISLAQTDDNTKEYILEVLKEAEGATFRAKGLANQLLTFAKGGTPLKEVQTISNLVKESTEFALRGSTVRAHFVLPDNLWRLNFDKDQMGQVFQNLVINAMQVMSNGGVIEIVGENLTISPEDKREFFIKDGKYVKLEIKDTGGGIPGNILTKIFDPYFTTKQNGSGLGLAVTYSIIKKHGGYITVISKVGSGTTFTILLPASIKEERKKPISEEKVGPSGKDGFYPVSTDS